MKKFIYLNSNLSGIGDRLYDIILVYTYSQYLKCNDLYLEWKIDNNIFDDVYGKTRKQKTPFREKDYLLENLLNYIELPKNIHFVSKEILIEMSNKENITFDIYMGVKYTVHTFCDIYIKENRDFFINQYYTNFKLITFKNIPEYIIQTFKNKKIITIHLRRGDKVIKNDDPCDGIRFQELEDLNKKTYDFINDCISKNHKDICFVSDEKDTKNEYIKLFDNKCNVINYNGNEINQTYIDIYCLTQSHIIFMSQNFSAFSLISSLINDVILYYPYNKGRITKYKKYPNLYYFS